MVNINIDENRCIGCKLCINDCPQNNIYLSQKKAKIKDICMECAHCAAICPKEAISFIGYDDDLIEIDYSKKLKPDELLYAIKVARSIRNFKPDTIPEDIISYLAETARYTPTAKNMQDIELIILDKNKDIVEEYAVKLFKRILSIIKVFNKKYRDFEIDKNFFFKKAPIVILVLAKDKTNAILSASNMSLMAQSHGLGVLFSGFFVFASKLSFSIKNILNIRGNKKVHAALVIGYTDIKYKRGVYRKKTKVRRL